MHDYASYANVHSLINGITLTVTKSQRKTLSKPKRTFSVDIDLSRCRSCAVCWDEQVCEPKVLGFTPPFNKAVVVEAEACTGCRHCEWLCPDWAIIVRETTVSAPAAVTAGVTS